MSNYEQSVSLPVRGDGSKEWATQHMRAAQLRARGHDWPTVSDDLGYALSTVQNYTQLDGWSALVSHYRDTLWNQEVENFFYAGSLEALGALRDQWRAGQHEVAVLEERLADGDYEDASERHNLERQIYSRSKAVTAAADKFLRNIGFATHRKRVTELDAEKSTTGHYGQTVRHEGGETPMQIESGAQRAIEIAEILHGLDIDRSPDPADDSDPQ